MTTFPRLPVACAALMSLTVPAAAAMTADAPGAIVFVAAARADIGTLATPRHPQTGQDRGRDLVTMTAREPAPRNARTRKLFTKDEFRGYTSDFLGPDLIFWTAPSSLLRKTR